jgi:hypothetical protein
MNPVTRALQTIAAIQSEAREPVHAEAASRCPIEPLRSQHLSASSLASSNGRDGPTAPSAIKGTANLNRGSGAPQIHQVKARSQALFARDREIRINKRDRVVVPPARDVTRHGVTVINGALLLAAALCLGWIGGLNSDSFFVKPASHSVEKVTSPTYPPDASAKSERLTVQGSSANTNAKATRAQTSESLLTKQAIAAPQPRRTDEGFHQTRTSARNETHNHRGLDPP